MGKLWPLILIHVAAGMVALFSGAGAMTFRKGSPRHRQSGNAFFVSMLLMTGLGATIAFLDPRGVVINVLMGYFTFYLTATAWLAGIRGEGETSIIDWAALVAVVTISAGFARYGLLALDSPKRAIDGIPVAFFAFWGGIAVWFAVNDVRMMVRGGVFAQQRIARHLWRMGLAFMIAALSFFVGQQKVMPPSWRGSNILFAPPLIVLGLMVYWLVRVKFTREYKKKEPQPALVTVVVALPRTESEAQLSGARG